MENKKVAVTGAGSGLGEALAKQFSQRGAEVYLLGRTKEKLVSTAEELPHNCEVHILDIRDQHQVNQLFKQLTPLDILVNNAGVGYFGPAEDISQEQTNQMIDTNLKGAIFCSQAVLPAMKEKNRGVIVNIISTAGKVGKAEEAVYCASKFGVRGFTASLARELEATPLQVMGIYMGGMKTSFWAGKLSNEKQKKFMSPEEVAGIILSNIKSSQQSKIEELVIKRQK